MGQITGIPEGASLPEGAQVSGVWYDHLTLTQRVAAFALAFFLTVISCGVALIFKVVQNLYVSAITGKVKYLALTYLKPQPLPPASPPERDLEKENLQWKTLVLNCLPIQEIPKDDPNFWFHRFRWRYPLFEGLFFGEFSAYQSLDFRSRTGWFLADEVQENREKAYEIRPYDKERCEYDNVGYVVGIGWYGGRENTPRDRHKGNLAGNTDHLYTGTPGYNPLNYEELDITLFFNRSGKIVVEDFKMEFPRIFAFLDKARKCRTDDQSILIYDRVETSCCIAILTAYLYHCFKGEVSIDAILNYIKSKRPIGGLREDIMDCLKLLEQRGIS